MMTEVTVTMTAIMMTATAVIMTSQVMRRAVMIPHMTTVMMIPHTMTAMRIPAAVAMMIRTILPEQSLPLKNTEARLCTADVNCNKGGRSKSIMRMKLDISG